MHFYFEEIHRFSLLSLFSCSDILQFVNYKEKNKMFNIGAIMYSVIQGVWIDPRYFPIKSKYFTVRHYIKKSLGKIDFTNFLCIKSFVKLIFTQKFNFYLVTYWPTVYLDFRVNYTYCAYFTRAYFYYLIVASLAELNCDSIFWIFWL